jgi:hypothetical protein
MTASIVFGKFHGGSSGVAFFLEATYDKLHCASGLHAFGVAFVD